MNFLHSFLIVLSGLAVFAMATRLVFGVTEKIAAAPLLDFVISFFT